MAIYVGRQLVLRVDGREIPVESCVMRMERADVSDASSRGPRHIPGDFMIEVETTDGRVGDLLTRHRTDEAASATNPCALCGEPITLLGGYLINRPGLDFERYCSADCLRVAADGWED